MQSAGVFIAPCPCVTWRVAAVSRSELPRCLPQHCAAWRSPARHDLWIVAVVQRGNKYTYMTPCWCIYPRFVNYPQFITLLLLVRLPFDYWEEMSYKDWSFTFICGYICSAAPYMCSGAFIHPSSAPHRYGGTLTHPSAAPRRYGCAFIHLSAASRRYGGAI